MSYRRGLGTALVLATLVVPGVMRPASATATIATMSPTIEVAVQARFGTDANGNGLIDLPNTAAYVHGVAPGSCDPSCPEARFPVRLMAGLEGVDPELAVLPVFRYEWRVVGIGLDEPAEGSGQIFDVRLPEGDYWVDLAVRLALPWGSIRMHTSTALPVVDLLVVAMGDSYASGEGNPERTQAETGVGGTWADGLGDIQVEAAHAAARRSTVAWPARVALALEAADPATSVTFVSVAASSARIEDGLLGPQENVADQGQIDQVAALVGERRIDLLLMTIGGNDIGFSRIIRGLVDADPLFDPFCYDTDLDNIWAAARDGEWNRSTVLRPGLPWGLECRAVRNEAGFWIPGLDGLAAEYDRLAAALGRALWIDRTVIMEYPDPTGRERTGGSDFCGEIVGDILSPFKLLEIDLAEQQGGRAKVIEPLNAAVAAAARRHDWELVDGVADTFFDGHGYCAREPSYGNDGAFYRNPGVVALAPDPDDRVTSWFRTAGQSSELQGPGRRHETTGTLHPNELGHAAMAHLALQRIGQIAPAQVLAGN